MSLPNGTTAHDGRNFQRRRRPQLATLVALGLIAAAVLAFSWGWRDGDLVVDGPGTALFVELARRNLTGGGLHYWEPSMWTGTPLPAVAPQLVFLLLSPVAALLGTEEAIKVAILGGQVAGGLGAYSLARTIWRDDIAATTTGVLYSLSPIMTQHAGVGDASAIWALALMPWFLRSTLVGIRKGRRGHILLAGVSGATIVAIHAQHAYGLALLVTLLLVVEAARSGSRGPGALRALAARLLGIGVIGMGLLAHVLLPILTSKGWFILSPGAVVNFTLHQGLAAEVGHDLGAFLARPAGSASFGSSLAWTRNGGFYLGSVGVLAGVLAVWLAPRHDRNGEITAALVAAWMAVWVSTGAFTLAEGTLPSHNVAAVAFGGFVAGGLATRYLAVLGLRRRPAVVATVLAVLFLAASPYLRPFLLLRRFVPLFGDVRMPRLYSITGMVVALAAGFLVLVIGRRDRPAGADLSADRLRVGFALLLCLAVVADIWPLRDHYRGVEVGVADARRVIRSIGPVEPTHPRIAIDDISLPAPFLAAARERRAVANGWPHFAAGHDSWAAVGSGTLLPEGMRDRRLALAATGWIVRARGLTPRQRTRRAPVATRVREPLPMVRAYSQVVRTTAHSLGVGLAAALAPKGIGVVSGGKDAALRAVAVRGLGPAMCGPERPDDDELAGVVAQVCSEASWTGLLEGSRRLGGKPSSVVGATFRAAADDLSGVAVRAVDVPGVQLHLHEERNGRIGKRVAIGLQREPLPSQAGLTRFSFPAVRDSSGHDYAFFLSCDTCKGEGPNLYSSRALHGDGNAIANGVLDAEAAAHFVLEYPDVEAVTTRTTVTGRSPEAGAWDITASGPKSALVVVAESWFPGWTVTIDDRPARVLEADGAFIGVVVPGGRHRIEFRYRRPRAADVGVAVSGLTLAGALVWALLGGRGRRRRRTARP